LKRTSKRTKRKLRKPKKKPMLSSQLKRKLLRSSRNLLKTRKMQLQPKRRRSTIRSRMPRRT